jgi:hypothetical protein
LIWFEEGRSDFLRQNGLNYTNFEKAGYFVVVARAELDYKAPAFYEDEVTIETTLERQRGKVLSSPTALSISRRCCWPPGARSTWWWIAAASRFLCLRRSLKR